MRILTLDDFDTKGKTVFLRVDMNVPIDPKSMEIIEKTRIRESTESIKNLEKSKVEITYQQGRLVFFHVEMNGPKDPKKMEIIETT